MDLYRHQVAAMPECRSSNNFDGFMDADVSHIAGHSLIAAHVHKHIVTGSVVVCHDYDNKLILKGSKATKILLLAERSSLSLLLLLPFICCFSFLFLLDSFKRYHATSYITSLHVTTYLRVSSID